MQMSTLDSYQSSSKHNNTVHLGMREMQAVCMNAVTGKE